MGVVATAAVIGLGAAPTTVANAAAAPTLTLTSTAFADKGNIPATPTTLKEGLGLGFDVPDIAGAHQKAMGSNNLALQYFGPCPGGKNHKYVFTLYALKVAKLSGLTRKSTAIEAVTAAKANALATATLSGNSAAKVK
jgi:phosphatidylethanolamine-binding protein (PEBP) family uncharacterized protein